MKAPVIRKALRVAGQSVDLRNATVEDAEFILSMRQSARSLEHLTSTSQQLEDQIAWMRGYENRTDEAYFVIVGHDGRKVGTVRLYDAKGDSFCWGSWTMSESAGATAAMESALLVYRYALDRLGFSAAHFQVRKGNARVRAFHERFGAVAVGEDQDSVDYTITEEAIRQSLARYRRFSPENLVVEMLP